MENIIKNNPFLSVVIPLHNEEESVVELYQRLKKVLDGLRLSGSAKTHHRSLGKDYEILFVNDGSTDRTGEVLAELFQKDERVKVIELRTNFGKAPALSAGFDHARGDIILSMDGDLQDCPEEIPLFLEKIDGGYDVVSGWRQQRDIPFFTRKLVLNTNGYQSRRIIEFAREMASGGSLPKAGATFHFRVSMDGVGERHDEIRGVKGSFERAQQTLEELIRLRKGKGLCVGVNLTITRRNIDQIEPLQVFCQRLGIDLQYQVARRDRYLYENYQEGERQMELDFFDSFSQDEIERIVEGLSRDNISFNFKEGLIKKFFNEGLKNRLLYSKREPDTQCVALTSHIRILPDGRVPICIQSNTRVGDLTEETLEELWFGQKIERYRKMVRECPGCWMPCDVIPSAIYTGSFLKTLL